MKEKDGAGINCAKWLQDVALSLDTLNQLYWLNILFREKRGLVYV
jgi:hypothetical protein